MALPVPNTSSNVLIDIDAVLRILKKEVVHYRVPVVDLVKVQTKDPAKILVATILSARTKDEVTKNAAFRLFQRMKVLDDLERMPLAAIEKLIFPVGFYKTKAKHLKQLPRVLREEFNSHIPHTVDGLVRLPGVGRKTANLVVALGFSKPAVCVDTHVHKIMNRLGYVRTKTPLQTEMALRKKLPVKHWLSFNSILVAFGQFTCTPVSPFCSRCPVRKYCRRVGVRLSR